MLTISLCMIVRDAAETLVTCLESIKGCVEEIIIVDTGSHDGTVEIAKRYTERVYMMEWQDDFSQARNFSFEQATQDYIMWLDADDWVSPNERQKLQLLKGTLDTRIDIVMMNYEIEYDEHQRLVLSAYRERLVKREKGMKWVEPVHEVIEMKGYVYFSDLAIIHKGKARSNTQRNLLIYQKYLAKGNTLSTRGKLYYARELYENKIYRKAKEHFIQFLIEEEEDAEGCANACLMIAECNHYLGEKDIDILYRSFKYTPAKKEICCQIGNYLLEEKDYKKAIFWYELTLELPSIPYGVGAKYHDQEGYWPHMGLYECYMKLGSRDKAVIHNEAAAKLNSQDERVRGNRLSYT